jgi:hypothetical protein
MAYFNENHPKFPASVGCDIWSVLFSYSIKSKVKLCLCFFN